MERIEKEETKKVFTTVFVATDGTEFRDQRSCEQYEQSLECALTARLNDITISKSDLYSVFFEGSEENEARVVRPRNSDDINAINQLVCFVQGTKPDKMDEKYLVKDSNIGECIVLCYSYEHDDVWIHTETEIRNHFDRLFTKKD